MAGGDAKSDLKWVIGIFLALGLLWLASGGPARYEATSGPFLESPLATTTRSGWRGWFSLGPTLPRVSEIRSVRPSVITSPSGSDSGYVTTARDFSLSAGNARYVYQPNQEYVTLTYRGKVPVDITGWYLVNGNARRLYEAGGGLARGVNASAVIPPVAKLFDPRAGRQAVGNLILPPGGRVYIYTGSLSPTISQVSTHAGASLQLNLCTGYLDNSLRSGCLRPADWLPANQIATQCQEFVKNLGACHEPKFTQKVNGDLYVDNQPNKLTSQCRAFVEQTYNYAGCVAALAGRADFYRPEWRVYLDRPWELWAKADETVSLYDRAGHLITEIKW